MAFYCGWIEHRRPADQVIEPFPESALNEQAGKMLLENYEEYARHAKPSLVSEWNMAMEVSGSTAAAVAVATTQKKEVGLAKAHADKKKMDARKKSLKRL
uniref:Uncharacterized protein n=1 Tax=Fagus sylvatica TaxID=28930 RepID=A0A2N9FDF1_FAGSY